MINTAETIPPEKQPSKKMNAAETLPPDGDVSVAKSTNLLPGESISSSYIVHSLLEKQGKQAKIYVAKKHGQTYAIKIYHNGWHPHLEIQEFLLNVTHPNIVRVIENGFISNDYYEICEFFSEGTLEDASALPLSHIQQIIVPSVNEGLHELHRNGIVHCDIKPSNIFYGKQKNKVLIGDCGISGFMNSDGKLIGPIRGTPEYAPGVKTIGWNAIITPAYDYGSFGLVLCKAILGRSLFSGMSMQEIAAARDKGIQLPGKINGRLRSLINGLIEENEDKRWGYSEVKKWCEGEFVNSVSRNIYTPGIKKREIKKLVFGRFDGEILTVQTLHQLANAIYAHWQHAVKLIRERELIDFVRQFDPSLTERLKDIAKIKDSDVAVYHLLLCIEPDDDEIHFGGNVYKSLNDYVNSLIQGTDALAIKFLSSGLLIEYLKTAGYDQMQISRLKQLIQRTGCNNMNSILTIAFQIVEKNSINVFDRQVNNIDDLIMAIYGHLTEEINDLLNHPELIAWMNRMGFEKEMRKMKEML